MYLCRQATRHMTEAREGTLAGADRMWFGIHMVICAHCRAYRRQLDLTVAMAKEVPSEPVPDKVEERLVEAFRARKTPKD